MTPTPPSSILAYRATIEGKVWQSPNSAIPRRGATTSKPVIGGLCHSYRTIQYLGPSGQEGRMSRLHMHPKTILLRASDG